MDLSRLANLRRHVPDELYDIEPGQIVYFVSKEGMDKQSFNTLMLIFRFFTHLKMSDFRIRIIPTDNEILIGNIACRNIEEISIPYMIYVGPWETIIGLVSKYYGVSGGTVMRRFGPMGAAIHNSISFELPLAFPINPENCPVKQHTYNNSILSDGFGMEVLQRRPESENEKKEMAAKYATKLRKIIWECAYLGVDLDIDGIVKETEESKTKTEGYGLSLQMTQDKTSGLIDCKVFVGEGLELKVTPIRKAIYLTFLTLEDGLVIQEATPDFTKIIQKIYGLLPDKEQKDNEENTGRQGIMFTDYIQPNTLRGYMSNINAAIAKLIPNGLIATEFGIEGYQNGAFKVLRSTPEIRKQIIKAFNL